MKLKLTLSTVLITTISIIANSILFFIDVDFEFYKPFMFALSIGWITAGVSVVLIIMSLAYRFTSIVDRQTNRIICLLSAIVIAIGIVSALRTTFTEYETYDSKRTSEETVLELIKDKVPYKEESKEYDRLFADRFGKKEVIEIIQAQLYNDYWAIYYKSDNIYLNKRFAVQYNPAFAPAYDFHSNLTPTENYSIKRSGLKIKVFINDYITNDYAVIISTLSDAMYIELLNVDITKVTVDDFIDEAVNQFYGMRNTDFDNNLLWY